MKKSRTIHQLAPLAAMLVLAAIGVAAMARPNAADAEPYHAAIRAAVQAAPRQIDGWVGQDEEVPPAAQRLLKPNALLSRQYVDIDTGWAANFVVVHTRDARDMLGHYPPNCYPNSGWTLESAATRTWEAAGMTLQGVRYTFSFSRDQGDLGMVVDNLIILPGGAFATDMADVLRLSADYTRRFFGAAQIQLITEARLTETQRDAVFHTLMQANEPLLQALAAAPGSAALPQAHHEH